ncbi:hypothetical protein GW17_00034426 [Ensete ventricosum]|nr:hypothetical protein GW17_00034426 [Ensete ventricosum]
MPSSRSPCFTASPWPPTAALELDGGGAPGGDRGLPPTSKHTSSSPPLSPQSSSPIFHGNLSAATAPPHLPHVAPSCHRLSLSFGGANHPPLLCCSVDDRDLCASGLSDHCFLYQRRSLHRAVDAPSLRWLQ